jgi:hypothetical protein
MSRKARRPSIHTLIAQVEKVGRPVKRVIFTPEGGFELIFAEDEASGTSTNPEMLAAHGGMD